MRQIIDESKLIQMPKELQEKLKNVTHDEDMDLLGFKCCGKLQDFLGYQNMYERFWVWLTKVEDGHQYISVTSDNGNGHCTVVSTDLPIEIQ